MFHFLEDELLLLGDPGEPRRLGARFRPVPPPLRPFCPDAIHLHQRPQLRRVLAQKLLGVGGLAA